LRCRRRPVALVIVVGVLLYLGLPYGPQVWSAYISKPEIFTPLFTPIAALLVGLAAFGQWRTARLRHEEQTEADRRRRITESYSKAVSQLASDKIEERLGGIYTLESISKESPADYWTVMETLTAFVRERVKRKEAAKDVPWTMAAFYESKEPTVAGGLRTDIAAVLSVITRRDGSNYQRENEKGWRFNLQDSDLSRADLDGANLYRAGLIGANLSYANLLYADLTGANLYHANLSRARLTGANLSYAYLLHADLSRAKLTGANLTGATLSRATLSRADLGGVNLTDVNLTDVNLTDAIGLWQPQLDEACGTGVRLPAGLRLDKPCPDR
jgi:hypothetical protein